MENTLGRRLDIRVFLEGIEVPCVSAAIQISFDAPATATFQCIPTPSSARIKARTSVHAFFRNLEDPSSTEPLLFFIGEIVGLAVQRTPMSQSITFQAIDDSSYWDTAYQYFVSYGRGIDWIFQQKSSFVGSGVGLFDNILREHASVLGDLMRTPPRSRPYLRGLLGGVVHILEAVGGVPGRFRGFNDFFSMAEMRRKILSQISAAEGDDTSVRIYNHKVFWQWLMRELGSAGTMVSIRDMLKLTFKYIFHHVVPCPIAKYDPLEKEVVKTNSSPFSATSQGKAIIKKLEKVDQALASVLDGTAEIYRQILRGILVFRNLRDEEIKQKKAYGTLGITKAKEIKEAYKRGVTIVGGFVNRTIPKLVEELKALERPLGARASSVISDLQNWSKACKRVFDRLQKEEGMGIPSSIDLKLFPSASKKWVYYPEDPRFVEFVSLLFGPASAPNSWENGGRVFYLDATDRFRYPPHELTFEAKTNLYSEGRISYGLGKMRDSIRALFAYMGIAKVSWRTRERHGDLLHNQLFVPELWFVAPPRCNVFFPEDVMQFQYQREFLNEITRMELTTAMELIQPNFITNSRYFAPDVRDLTGRHTLSAARSGVRLILPHEIYTGIIPRFEFMSEANIYAALSDQKKSLREEAQTIRGQVKQLEKLRKEAKASNRRDELALYQKRIKALEGRATTLEVGGLPYIQRAVNYLFFKQRYASRQIGLQGPFTPRIVPAFPAVVLSNHFSPNPRGLNPHFIGLVAGLSHTVSHEGGTTSATLTMARAYDGQDDDYLNIDQGSRMVGKRVVKTALRPAGLRDHIVGVTREIATLKKQLQTPTTKARIAQRQRALADWVRQAKFVTEVAARTTDTKTSAEGLRVLDIREETAAEIAARKSKEAKRRAILGIPEPPTTAASKDAKQRNPLAFLIGKRGPRGGIIVDAKVTGSKTAVRIFSAPERAAERKNIAELAVFGDGFFTSTEYLIFERVSAARPLDRSTIPFEAQVFPTWVSPIYRNETIGSRKLSSGRRGPYEQFFGVRSIVTEDTLTPNNTQLSASGQASVLTQVGHPLPSKTIKEAVEELSSVYNRIKMDGQDVHAFIRSYTSRPIATMSQILGSPDLQVSEDGKVIAGTSGFHSFAFGNFDQLQGFDNTAVRRIGGRGKPLKVAQELDTRKKKRDAVLRYREELNRGSGQRGG